MTQRRPWLLALSFFLLACSKDKPPPPPAAPDEGGASQMCADSETVDVDEEMQPEVNCNTGERILLCFGNWAAHCDADGELVSLENCREDHLVCATHKCKSAKDCTGCRKCVPGDVQCGDHGELRICDADGSGYSLKDTCDESHGKYCSLSSGECEDLCDTADREHSYIGCDYWAVATSNAQLLFESQDADGICHPFSFAVVVANPQGIDAEVTVHSPGYGDRTLTVPPSETKTIELPCAPELKGEPIGASDADAGAIDDVRYSVLTDHAAQHITSNVPITVYQFNPLEFQSKDAAGEKAYSYTADSSLLLPTSSMTGNYVVMTQPTLLHQLKRTQEPIETVNHSGPGFVAITGVSAEPVDVEITSSAYTQPSEDGSIPALAPGQKHTFTLAQGETLQLLSAVPDQCSGKPEDGFPGGTYTYCKVPDSFDLTGTRIAASGRVAVISGHDCVFLPRNRWACDHIEESMFPIEAWGKESYIAVSESVACQPTVPNMVRVYSDSDGNRVTFTPAVHDPITLAKGEYVEFEVSKDFHVYGSQAILVAQYLLGQDYEGRGSAGSYAKGDPSMSLGEPLEQWRKRYAFLTPDTYTDNYVNIIARDKQLVLLDGRAVAGFSRIEGTKMSTARVPIKGGEHRVESAQTIGIVVYGYAPYTSYMMPGGLDLQPINGPD